VTLSCLTPNGCDPQRLSPVGQVRSGSRSPQPPSLSGHAPTISGGGDLVSEAWLTTGEPSPAPPPRPPVHPVRPPNPAGHPTRQAFYSPGTQGRRTILPSLPAATPQFFSELRGNPPGRTVKNTSADLGNPSPRV
jgi:hypothetical protein